MEYRKYFKYLCLSSLSMFSIYLLVINRNNLVQISFKIPMAISNTTCTLCSENTSIRNRTKDSNLKLLSLETQFKSRYSDYYPHLPIHIFTQNLSLTGNISKLILLGNGFSGRRDWGIGSPNRSSTEKSTIYCLRYI